MMGSQNLDNKMTLPRFNPLHFKKYLIFIQHSGEVSTYVLEQKLHSTTDEYNNYQECRAE